MPAKGIIIAADKNVDRARFGGKQVLSTNVSAGINEPEKLIQTILDGKAPVQEGATVTAAETAGEKDSAWHVMHQHLMNGVSHMLPFVIGGGILTAIAFLIDQPERSARRRTAPRFPRRPSLRPSAARPSA